MWAALGWGALAASSLVIGVWLAFVRSWSQALIGSVLAFGAGALISAVSLELVEEGLRLGSGGAVAAGLALGALTYFIANRALASRGKRAPKTALAKTAPGETAPAKSGGGSGMSLALGSFLDGIPEQAVLGIGLAGGQPVSVALLVAIFVSNLPEGIGSAIDMGAAGTPRKRIIRLFLVVGLVCTLSTVAGFAIADSVSGDFQAAIEGFAAGALLVMLIDSMIPESKQKAGQYAGLVAVVGFAVATALSTVS
jgi:zinc transporter, ZIP family